MTQTDIPRLLRLKQIIGDPRSDPFLWQIEA